VAHVELERLLLEKELAARDREDQRRRIARDLHDGLGADLTALLWQARALAAGASGGVGQSQIEALARVASDALAELRAVVDGIRGPLERWEQLEADLRLRASLLCGAAVAFEVRLGEGVQADGRVPPRVAVEVPRFVLEAVRNAVAHAACSRVGVRLGRAGEALVVEVEDDGRGLGEGERAASRGGLSHLDERARALGGTLEIEALSPGTRIVLRAPCSWDGGA
jgi:signal transduction histidine kinase